MHCTERLAVIFQERFALLCTCALVGGIIAGPAVGALAPAIPWLMAMLMFSSGLAIILSDISVLRAKPWLLPVILILLHVAVPALWMGIGTLLRFPLDAVMGFTLQAMLPISGSCAVWIGINRGNITLGMALLLVDTLTTPFIIPYVLTFMFGAVVDMDPFRMLRSLFWMLFLPTVTALTLNRLSGGRLGRSAGKPLADLGKLAILVILFINGGVVAPFFRTFDVRVVQLFGATFCLSLLLFFVSFLLGLLLFSRREDVIAFTLCAVRTTTTGMVIAMTYFTPLTTLTVVFTMIFQPPMAQWAGKRAHGFFDKKERALRDKAAEYDNPR